MPTGLSPQPIKLHRSNFYTFADFHSKIVPKPETKPMRGLRTFFYCLFALAVASCNQNSSRDLRSVFLEINSEVLANAEGYAQLESATSTIGHRLTGTENGAQAEELAHRLMTEYGLPEVEYRPFSARSWIRESAFISISNGISEWTPDVVSLAHSPVEADVSAEVIDAGNGLQSDFERLGPAVEGKVVLMTIRLQDTSGVQNLHRSEKARLAIDNKAAGVLFINNVPGAILLTGTASVTGDLIPIPAVCITMEDGDTLRARLGRNNLSARIQVKNKSEIITARNVIGTIPGSELPEEVVLIGGHLDSWDLATGALDNGIGSFTILDIARTFSKLNLTPKRTIKFVLFMGEEEGLLGSKDYVKTLKESGEIDNVRYMLNLDMAGNPSGFNCAGRNEMVAYFDSVGAIIADMDTVFKNENRNSAGLHSDHQPFMMEGIPVASPNSNMDHGIYKCYHSSCDDFSIISEVDMVNGARFTGMLLYALADAERIPAGRLSEEKIEEFCVKQGLKEKLILGRDWRWSE